MDPILLYEILDDHREWEIVVLPDDRGVVIGDHNLIDSILSSLELTERCADGN